MKYIFDLHMTCAKNRLKLLGQLHFPDFPNKRMEDLFILYFAYYSSARYTCILLQLPSKILIKSFGFKKT
jgi:hypothetical protein